MSRNIYIKPLGQSYYFANQEQLLHLAMSFVGIGSCAQILTQSPSISPK